MWSGAEVTFECPDGVKKGNVPNAPAPNANAFYLVSHADLDKLDKSMKALEADISSIKHHEGHNRITIGNPGFFSAAVAAEPAPA